MPKTNSTYQSLNEELEHVLAALQTPNVQVDEAVKLYEKGLKLIEALQTHLTQAETTITKLSVRATASED